MLHGVFVCYLVVAILLPDRLLAQPRKPATVSEISTYMGADREQMLYAGAKGEGVITWYTSLAGDSYKALSRAFEDEISRSARRSFSRRRQRPGRAHVGGNQSAPADHGHARNDVRFHDGVEGLRPHPAVQFTAARRLPQRSQREGRCRPDVLDDFSRVVHGVRFQQGASFGQCSAQRFRRSAPSAAQRQNGHHAQ